MSNMRLTGTSLDHLRDRQQLLTGFDRFRRHLDASPRWQGADVFTQKAFDVLASGKLVGAMDLQQEPDSLQNRYGRETHRPHLAKTPGALDGPVPDGSPTG